VKKNKNKVFAAGVQSFFGGKKIPGGKAARSAGEGSVFCCVGVRKKTRIKFLPPAFNLFFGGEKFRAEKQRNRPGKVRPFVASGCEKKQE